MNDYITQQDVFEFFKSIRPFMYFVFITCAVFWLQQFINLFMFVVHIIDVMKDRKERLNHNISKNE